MFKYLIFILILCLVGFGGWYVGKNIDLNLPTQISATPTPIPTPLAKYTVENLSKENIKSGKFQIIDTISEEDKYTAHLFKLTFDPEINSNNLRETTGQINIPKGEGTFPLIVMFRGYVDQTIYQTGIGTSAGADFFANNGYITVAPDFLGYAQSDSEAGNIFESRFQTYTTAISLVDSLNQINKWNNQKVYIWAHSNSGQIALTVLEATGLSYPTTLWAPVSKPFPYSVLYYTDESADRGKFIRSELAKFEAIYNADQFAITDYFDKIKAPVQLHQGTSDDAIPVDWSNQLDKQLENAGVEVNYFVYPGADHNLRPSWDTVIQRDLEFFQSN